MNAPMGNRGIRRDVASGGYTIDIIARAVKSTLDEYDGGAGIGVILPLVSHYSQIKFAVERLLQNGLSLHGDGASDRNAVYFGWEIEQPAASQNNLLWMEAFSHDYGRPPHVIGIGTNDLTQFTIALGRDAASEETDAIYSEYLGSLYDERDFSVVRQIAEVSAQCRARGTRLFILGQIGADPVFASLMFALNVIPSVGSSRVSEVREIARDYKRYGAKPALQAYIKYVLSQYPEKTRGVLEAQLQKFFDTNIDSISKGESI
jgi:phosphoenolpyruvate-protein kinase (PTS system EI component)